MKGILKYIKPYGAYMLLTLFLKFTAAMMDLLIPSLLAKIIDDIVPTKEVRMIFWCGGVMLICAVLSITTNVTANRMAEVSAGGMTRQLRHDLFSKITYLSAKQIDDFTISSVVSRLTSDTYNVNRMLARMQRLGVRGADPPDWRDSDHCEYGAEIDLGFGDGFVFYHIDCVDRHEEEHPGLWKAAKSIG